MRIFVHIFMRIFHLNTVFYRETVPIASPKCDIPVPNVMIQSKVWKSMWHSSLRCDIPVYDVTVQSLLIIISLSDIIASHKSHTSISTFKIKVSPEIYISEYQIESYFLVIIEILKFQFKLMIWFHYN